MVKLLGCLVLLAVLSITQQSGFWSRDSKPSKTKWNIYSKIDDGKFVYRILHGHKQKPDGFTFALKNASIQPLDEYQKPSNESQIKHVISVVVDGTIYTGTTSDLYDNGSKIEGEHIENCVFRKLLLQDVFKERKDLMNAVQNLHNTFYPLKQFEGFNNVEAATIVAQTMVEDVESVEEKIQDLKIIAFEAPEGSVIRPNGIMEIKNYLTDIKTPVNVLLKLRVRNAAEIVVLKAEKGSAEREKESAERATDEEKRKTTKFMIAVEAFYKRFNATTDLKGFENVEQATSSFSTMTTKFGAVETKCQEIISKYEGDANHEGDAHDGVAKHEGVVNHEGDSKPVGILKVKSYLDNIEATVVALLASDTSAKSRIESAENRARTADQEKTAAELKAEGLMTAVKDYHKMLIGSKDRREIAIIPDKSSLATMNDTFERLKVECQKLMARVIGSETQELPIGISGIYMFLQSSFITVDRYMESARLMTLKLPYGGIDHTKHSPPLLEINTNPFVFKAGLPVGTSQTPPFPVPDPYDREKSPATGKSPSPTSSVTHHFNLSHLDQSHRTTGSVTPHESKLSTPVGNSKQSIPGSFSPLPSSASSSTASSSPALAASLSSPFA